MLVVRHMRPRSVPAAPDTLFNYELVSLLSMLIRILALLVAALLLFRCGPVDGRFLAGNTESTNTAGNRFLGRLRRRLVSPRCLGICWKVAPGVRMRCSSIPAQSGGTTIWQPW
jgi:hypothetical protein